MKVNDVLPKFQVKETYLSFSFYRKLLVSNDYENYFHWLFDYGALGKNYLDVDSKLNFF